MSIEINGGKIRIEFDDNLYSRVVSKICNREVVIGDFCPSEIITVNGEKNYKFQFKTIESHCIKDEIGIGKEYKITGSNNYLEKNTYIKLYEEFPTMAFFKVKYLNISEISLNINEWINNSYNINSCNSSEEEFDFWAYQSGSYEDRRDWILPIKKGFSQENYMGMNNSDYGGGTPVVDIWRKDIGIAVGHVELEPKLLSLPLRMSDNSKAEIAVKCVVNKSLGVNEGFSTYDTFVCIHDNDYYNALSEYRKFITKKGFKFGNPVEGDYEAIWCAWGYERNFTVEQIIGCLPMVKKLGFKWVCIDDGWQDEEGYWKLDVKKFPNGDSDMQSLVNSIHGHGLKAQLWFAPLAIDPNSELFKDHSEYLIINKEGKYQDITFWDDYYECPACKEVIQLTEEIVNNIIGVWGFDGLKLDGQHLNAAPACYNKSHHHAYPEESYEKLSYFYKHIYDKVLNLNPEGVIMFCPCGTAYSIFNLPYVNQTVSSDPLNSKQVRTKGKTLKAIGGEESVFYGDHVELSDGGMDFASTIGVGGVIGSKFTWPDKIELEDSVEEENNIFLDKEREVIWGNWVRIYNEKLLSKGQYLGGLYDIGFDFPETHAISKDGKMYYAFYADSFEGTVELRGLKCKEYKVKDYVKNIELGIIKGENGKIKVKFEDYLLIEVI